MKFDENWNKIMKIGAYTFLITGGTLGVLYLFYCYDDHIEDKSQSNPFESEDNSMNVTINNDPMCKIKDCTTQSLMPETRRLSQNVKYQYLNVHGKLRTNSSKEIVMAKELLFQAPRRNTQTPTSLAQGFETATNEKTRKSRFFSQNQMEEIDDDL